MTPWCWVQGAISSFRRLIPHLNAHKVTQEDQDVVEDAVWEFNSQVTYCPALQHQVHRFCKGSRRTYYHHLHDGLHLSEDLKIKWANQFLKAMAHN